MGCVFVEAVAPHAPRAPDEPHVVVEPLALKAVQVNDAALEKGGQVLRKNGARLVGRETAGRGGGLSQGSGKDVSPERGGEGFGKSRLARTETKEPTGYRCSSLRALSRMLL